jgi:hypothetical protein
MNAQEIINFHTEIQVLLINAYKERGVDTVEKINQLTAKSKLEDALWKIPEAGQKNNPRYISEGIKTIRDILDRNGFKRHPKSIWTKKDIQLLIQNHSSEIPSTDPDYYKYQFEHVVEKQTLIPLLFKANNDDEIRHILSTYNIGCLVLMHEHKVLPNRHFDENNPWARYKKARIKVWDNFDNKFI